MQNCPNMNPYFTQPNNIPNTNPYPQQPVPIPSVWPAIMDTNPAFTAAINRLAAAIEKLIEGKNA